MEIKLGLCVHVDILKGTETVQYIIFLPFLQEKRCMSIPLLQLETKQRSHMDGRLNICQGVLFSYKKQSIHEPERFFVEVE